MAKKHPDFGDRDQRIRKACERLGSDNPKCAVCGEANPLCLELHHIAQHKFSAETIILCSNHHDNASDWQKEHPVKIEGCTSILEVSGHWLLGLGDLLRIAADEPFAEQLRELLLYVASKLRTFGIALIDMARLAPTVMAEVSS